MKFSNRYCAALFIMGCNCLMSPSHEKSENIYNESLGHVEYQNKELCS